MKEKKYDEAFISVFKYNIRENKEETFFVEHNEELNIHDIKLIKSLSIDMVLEVQETFKIPLILQCKTWNFMV